MSHPVKNTKLINLLKKLPIFSGLYDDEFLPLCEICKGFTVPADDFVFRQGDASRSMFVLLSGRIDVEIDEKGKVYTLSPGNMFGEMGMITQDSRSASARASVDSTVMEFSNTDYNLLLGKHPRVSAIIMRRIAENLAGHIHRMNQQ